MSITRKLKWKRNIEHLKFLYAEIDSLKELIHSTGPEFQEYYETFCVRNHIDRAALNEQHSDRVQELYGSAQPDTDDTDNNEPDINYSDVTAIVPHSNPSPSENIPISEDDREMHEAFSKLFKNIALVLHPDRIDKSLPEHIQKDMVSRFQEANKAMRERKYFILLDVANQFGIKPPRNQTQQVRWMKREAKVMQQQIQVQKKTYSYQFSEFETDEQRDELIKQFLYQLFRFKLPENS